MTQTTKVAHRTVKVRDLDVFYREAGPKDAPAVLLLHGFPTSPQMFRNLIPSLADRYRLLAPDYPGFGHSSMPPRHEFAYTFDNLAAVVEEFTTILSLSKYALYVQDYGAPVGYRLASRYPDRVTAIVVQNGNAYAEGLDNDFWKPLKAYWQDPTSLEKRNALRGFSQRGGHPLAVHPRRPPSRVRLAGRLDHGSVFAGSQGQRRDPTRPVPELREQPAALPAMASVLPEVPAADADCVGRQRPDLPGGRGRALQARPQDAGVPPARSEERRVG